MARCCMAYRPTSNRWFSKAIVTRDGTKLPTIDDALKFLEALPNGQITSALDHAQGLLRQAREKGKTSNVEEARAELAKVFHDMGWL